MKRLTVAALILMFIASASATQIEVKPSQYSFDMMAGDTHKQELQLTWNGDNPTALEPSTDINAEKTGPKGFDISYSDKLIGLLPGDTKTVEVKIKADEALKTDNYTFETEFSTSVTVDDEDDNDDSPIVYTSTFDGDLNETQEERLKERVKELNEANLDLNESVEDLKQRLEEINELVKPEPVNLTDQNETSELKPGNEEEDEAVGLVELLVDIFLGWLS